MPTSDPPAEPAAEAVPAPGAAVHRPLPASRVPEARPRLRFDDLAAAVLDAERCIRCGTCVAACPARSIAVGVHGLPELLRRCAGCSTCWDFCARGGLAFDALRAAWAAFQGEAAPQSEPAPPAEAVETPSGLGPVLAAYQARAKRPADHAQDGGVVTALLAALLARGVLQGALVTRRLDALHGESVLATTPEQVRAGAGSVYCQTYPLAMLARGLPDGVRDVALVGTPCQIAGLRALQCFPWRYRRLPAARVALTIGLFCTRSFDPDRLALALLQRGVDLARVGRVDVRGGWLRAFDDAGTALFETKVRELRETTLPGCGACVDFAASLADIAVGNVGSQAGRTTVLIRTARGAAAWSAAADQLEAEPLPDLAPVLAMARRKAESARTTTGPDGPAAGRLWREYPEHLAARATPRGAAHG